MRLSRNALLLSAASSRRGELVLNKSLNVSTRETDDAASRVSAVASRTGEIANAEASVARTPTETNLCWARLAENLRSGVPYVEAARATLHPCIFVSNRSPDTFRDLHRIPSGRHRPIPVTGSLTSNLRLAAIRIDAPKAAGRR